MKFKHLGRQIVALLLSLCLAVSLIQLSAFAVPSVGTGNGVGEAGSAGIAGVWDITYSPSTTPFGCRVTLMDKSTGNRVPGVMSVDYTNDKSVADRVTMHAAKYCKSDYLKSGYSMIMYDGVISPKYYDAKTIPDMPQVIDNPNSTEVRDFFCKEGALMVVAQHMGISYDELISGNYKLMIEPIHYFHKYGSTEEMAFTATEYAILALNGADYSSISNRTRNAIPLALFLEDDDTDLGYNEYTGDTNANWNVNNKRNTGSTASNSGELRLGYSDIFSMSLGMAIVSFPENTQPHVYHHVYDLQVTVPKSFPLDSTGTLVGAAGAQKLFDNSKASGGLNATDAAALLKLLQLDENKSKLSDPNNWRVLADYDLITDNSLMGVYTEDNKQKYYASKDNRYMAELSTKLDNYLAVSSESTIILDPTDAYPGPEIRGFNANTVVRRYGGTTDEKYRNTNTNTTYYGLEFDMSTVEGLMKALVSSKDGTVSTWYSDNGLTVSDTVARDYHTATFALTFVNPPTKIYYHEITIEIDIPEGTPTPTTIDEVEQLIDDNPDITPEITWTQETGETNEDKYNPYKDDKIKTGDLKTGVLVGTLGYTETTKVENDRTNVYPQQGKDGADPADKLEKDQMDFETLKNVKKIPNSSIDLVENKIDEIHTVVVKFDFNEPKEPTPADPTPDRIKTYDVAQFIDDTTSTAGSSRHLDTLVGYVDNETSYNNTAMSAASHISNKAEAVIIKSKVLSFNPNSEVQAKNHVNTTVVQCGAQSHSAHSATVHYTDADGNDRTRTEPRGGYSGGAINKYTCHYTKETVVTGYGLSVTQKKHFRDSSGTLVMESGYKSPAELANSGSFTDVGFTIPYKYYTDPDVVKLVGSNNYSGSQNHFLLPNITGMPSQASRYAVFDTLFNSEDNKYWIKYFKGTEEVKYQSNKQTSEQQKQDYSDATADLDFSYTGTNNNPIDGVQFIAHRDLLSGDDVSTSLAVSGYMAKYADNSNTKNYLEFMKKSGFYIADPSNAISHANRTVCVANAALANQLQGTKNGKEVDAYNTDYTGGKSETNLTVQTHVRFGLGGLSADSVHLYNKYLSSSSEITDNSLDMEAEEGDALRSIWYTNQEGVGSTLNCYGSYSSSGHNLHCSYCSASHVCGPYSPLHSDVEQHSHWNAVSNNMYVLKDSDTYLDNGKYSSHAVYTQSQSDMFTDIYTSRETFRISLAVEGTTAGEYGADGLKYKPTNSKGKTMNGKSGTEDASLSVVDGYLTLTYNDPTIAATWRTNTFEMLKNNYQSVGEAKDIEKSNVLAEYRFTTPTDIYTFNPSYYMQYDDDFEDTNKSVWMLSEQPRKTNFKDILDIRLTYGEDATTNAGGVDANDVYNTEITSAWSTDNADVTTQNKTKLPTAKAANSYATKSDQVGGTITAYVVLQDPEFTGNPSATKAANDAKLAAYNEQMNSILSQFNGMKIPTSNTVVGDDDFSLATYSNMVNASSTNSQFRITDIQSGVSLLNDKEPMLFGAGTEAAFNVTTSDNSKSGVNNGSWSYYALAGYEVKPFDNTYSVGAENANVDLSDTTSANARQINNETIQTMSKAASHQKEILSELNDNLCGLMVEPWNASGKCLDIPRNTHPFIDEGGDFTWYSEDYEGFIVAVYEISFTVSGDGVIAGDSSRGDGKSITTDFRSIYRSESDWRAKTNALAALDGHKLDVYTSNTWNGFNISTFTDINAVTDLVGRKMSDQAKLSSSGEFTLLSKTGEKTVSEWSKTVDNYANGIYGVGLELANLKVSFGTGSVNLGSGTLQPIGGAGKPISFYYQPTYFNVRGSVYDTAR